jgi:Ca2+-binding RTX toxin-like protein
MTNLILVLGSQSDHRMDKYSVRTITLLATVIIISSFMLFAWSPLRSSSNSRVYAAGAIQCDSSTNPCEGTAADDNMKGDDGSNFIDGLEGDDNISGGGSSDAIQGDGGNDKMSGGPGNDALLTDEGNDVATGGDGNDRFEGQGGNDKLSGGPGDDQFSGGEGADTFKCGTGEMMKFLTLTRIRATSNLMIVRSSRFELEIIKK